MPCRSMPLGLSCTILLIWAGAIWGRSRACVSSSGAASPSRQAVRQHCGGAPKMALDFPSSGLVNGQVYQGTNGIIYTWSAAMGVWLSQGTGSSNASTSTTPPVNPGNGQLWWNSDLGRLMIFFIDASGPPGQWVPATPTPPQSVTGILSLYSEMILSSTAGQIDVTFPIGAKRVELDYYASLTTAADQVLYLRAMQSGVPITTANYTTTYIQGPIGGGPSSGWQPNVTTWYSGNGYIYWGRTVFQRPDVGYGNGDQSMIQAAGTRYKQQVEYEYNAMPAGVNGFRLYPGGGTFAVGSYVRCYVVQ